MASKARKAFDESCDDIDRLLEIHGDFGGSGPGRRVRLEVLNKSGIVLLTALWEAYCEDIAAEALKHMVEHAPEPERIPLELRKQIAKELRANSHELAPWELAGDHWRDFLDARLESMTDERNRRLNTPKASQIDDLFLRALGIPKVSSSWSWPGMSADSARAKLDKYVELRGAIAHRGSAARSVKKAAVSDYYAHVKRLVGETGGRVGQMAKRATGKRLW